MPRLCICVDDERTDGGGDCERLVKRSHVGTVCPYQSPPHSGNSLKQTLGVTRALMRNQYRAECTLIRAIVTLMEGTVMS